MQSKMSAIIFKQLKNKLNKKFKDKDSLQVKEVANFLDDQIRKTKNKGSKNNTEDSDHDSKGDKTTKSSKKKKGSGWS